MAMDGNMAANDIHSPSEDENNKENNVGYYVDIDPNKRFVVGQKGKGQL